MEKRFYWLYVTVFINVISFGMIFPILPLFASSFNASSFQVGMLTAVLSLAQFLGAPFAGRLSDRYGRKPVLVVAILISTIALFIISSAHSLSVIFLGMFFLGIGGAGILPTALAYIADITTGHDRSKYISRVTGTFALGFMVGPVVGGILSANSLSFPFLVSAFVSLLNFVIIFFFLHETHHERDTKLLLKKGFVNPMAFVNALRGEFGVLFFLLFAWSFYIANFNLTIPFFTLDRFSYGAFENGIFFSFVGLIAGITQWFILPQIEKKVGDKKIILTGLIFLIAGQLIVSFSPIPLIFFSIFSFIIFGSALLRPSLSSQLSKKATEGQGTTMGLAFSFESLGRVIGPILIGLAISNFGLVAPFFLSALVLGVGLILYHKYE